jgi:DNA-binding protein HU-beta
LAAENPTARAIEDGFSQGGLMTREQLASLLQKKTDIRTKAKAEEVIDSVLATIREELSSGGTVSIRGFGTFAVSRRSPRKGRNPRTGEVVDIPAANRVRFLPGKELKSSALQAGEGANRIWAMNRHITKQIEERLLELKSTIEEYRAQGEKLGGDARQVYQEIVKPRYEEARQRFKLLRGSSGYAWDEMRVGFEKAYAELREAFNRARKKI